METANLTKAHEHVRNAATATYDKSIATAGAEHELAASAFHEAAKDTHNDEASRILWLLEEHHSKLARLIKEPPRKKERNNDGPRQASDTTTSPPPARTSSRTASPSAGASSPTRAPSRRRLPQSSIASNLAEKRGIPGARRGTPTAAPVSVTNALASRNLLQQQSRKAEEAERQKEETRKEAPTPRELSPPPDESFNRFYSAFGNLISTISAPLAFTSLPLNPTTPSPSTTPHTIDDPPPALSRPPQSKTSQPPTSPSASTTIKASEPDLASLISKPALRALREDQSYPLGAPQESFYVVPPSGGTVSYASILRDPSSHAHAHAHPHHAAQDPALDAITEATEPGSGGLRGSSHEEFVDARESLNGPPSPTLSRRPRSQGKSSTGNHNNNNNNNNNSNNGSSGSGGSTSTPAVTNLPSIRAGRGTGHKTMEELALENETLRALIDKQAKRLSMWETTSQSSYNALAQSFRARGGAGAGAGGGGALRQQMSDPSALAQAQTLSQGAGTGAGAMSHLQAQREPPIPSIPTQYSQQHQPPSSTPHTQPPDSSAQATQSRIAHLESLLASQSTSITALESEKAQLARQNEKNSLVIGRYREQWEKLKAGARRKEMERRERGRGGVTEGRGGVGGEVEEGDGREDGKEKDKDGEEGNADADVEGRDGAKEKDGEDGGESDILESVTFGKA